jgi:hypothetical protein
VSLPAPPRPSLTQDQLFEEEKVQSEKVKYQWRVLEAQREREALEAAKNPKPQKKKELKAGSAIQDADVLATNPQLTEYHIEPGEKIMIYKRPVVVDRTLVSPLAEIKEVSPREPIPGK